MPDRFFSDEPLTSSRASLSGPEAHHLIHVMRAGPGTRVALFDGSGAEFAAVVERIGRDRVELSVGSPESIDRELPYQLTLAVALPKGDRQKWLVEKAVELGVGRLVPLCTQRGVAQPVEQALARLRRSVVEASKQCGRNRLMQIEPPRDWSKLVAETRDVPCRLLAHPAKAATDPPQWPTTAPASILAAVGPEGGFTDDEVALALASGWQPIDLGPRILRVETAALALAVVAAQCWA